MNNNSLVNLKVKEQAQILKELSKQDLSLNQQNKENKLQLKTKPIEHEFKIEGYDKDGDVYETIFQCNDLELANAVLEDLHKELRADKLVRSDAEEPFDHIQIIDEHETIYSLATVYDKEPKKILDENENLYDFIQKKDPSIENYIETDYQDFVNNYDQSEAISSKDELEVKANEKIEEYHEDIEEEIDDLEDDIFLSNNDPRWS